MTHERMRAIAQRCVEDMGVPDGLDLQGATDFVAAAIETALEEAGRPVGVDLRDRFAMAVATGLAANPHEIVITNRVEETARTAYQIADAMLAHRDRDLKPENAAGAGELVR